MQYIKFFFIFIILASTFLLGALFFLTQQAWIDFSVLENYNPGKASIVIDDTGAEWARFQIDRREPIQLKDMPNHLINAFLAAEDHDFFNHPGISWRGIARSVWVNISRFRKVQGASTITQQLVRLLFFDTQRTFQRKIKEQFLSLLVERQFTKEQILETYLNHIYFGCGIYGVQAACQRFWGKSVQNISIEQSALLAAIIRSPARYCPLLAPQESLRLRNVILHCMKTCKYITEQEYTTARAQPINLVASETGIALHAREMLRIQLEKLFGKQALYTHGLVIKTTLNKKTQHAAELTFSKHLKNIHETLSEHIDGALVAIDTHSGGIKAMIGGYNFYESQFNRVFARRQMGSILKPLVYAAALESGIPLTDTELDEPFTLVINNQEWSPLNADKKFHGIMTLACALSRSNNIITIKTLLRVGAQHIINRAYDCHLQEPLLPYPSLALGCTDQSVFTAAGMFNIFAHQGIYVEPHLIEWVKDQWGKKIWKYKPVTNRVISWRTASQIGKVLTIGMERFKKQTPENFVTGEAMGKTGTTNDARSCWFVGATPSLTTALYIGRDDNQPLGSQVYAVRTVFPLWLEFNMLVGSAEKQFSYEPQLTEITVHEKTGEPVAPDDSHAITLLI